MPEFNQLTGSYGPTQRQRIEQQLVDMLGSQHQVGDPTRGRIPGTAQPKRPDLTWFEHAGEQARQLAIHAMQQWFQSQERAHDPGRAHPIQGKVHPDWWRDDTTGGGSQAIAKDPLFPGASDGKVVAVFAAAGTVGGAIIGAGVGIAGGGGLAGAGDGATGGAIAGLITGVILGSTWVLIRHHLGSFPADDGTGNPRARANASSYTPDPETGSGRGPHAYGWIPDPETGTGGGPHGFAGMPNPDTGTGVGPHSFGG